MAAYLSLYVGKPPEKYFLLRHTKRDDFLIVREINDVITPMYPNNITEEVNRKTYYLLDEYESKLDVWFAYLRRKNINLFVAIWHSNNNFKFVILPFRKEPKYVRKRNTYEIKDVSFGEGKSINDVSYEIYNVYPSHEDSKINRFKQNFHFGQNGNLYEKAIVNDDLNTFLTNFKVCMLIYDPKEKDNIEIKDVWEHPGNVHTFNEIKDLIKALKELIYDERDNIVYKKFGVGSSENVAKADLIPGFLYETVSDDYGLIGFDPYTSIDARKKLTSLNWWINTKLNFSEGVLEYTISEGGVVKYVETEGISDNKAFFMRYPVKKTSFGAVRHKHIKDNCLLIQIENLTNGDNRISVLLGENVYFPKANSTDVKKSIEDASFEDLVVCETLTEAYLVFLSNKGQTLNIIDKENNKLVLFTDAENDSDFITIKFETPKSVPRITYNNNSEIYPFLVDIETDSMSPLNFENNFEDVISYLKEQDEHQRLILYHLKTKRVVSYETPIQTIEFVKGNIEITIKESTIKLHIFDIYQPGFLINSDEWVCWYGKQNDENNPFEFFKFLSKLDTNEVIILNGNDEIKMTIDYFLFSCYQRNEIKIDDMEYECSIDFKNNKILFEAEGNTFVGKFKDFKTL